VPNDPRIARLQKTATVVVYSPKTQIVIPDGYTVNGVYGTTLATVPAAGQTLDTLLRLKGFKAVAVDGSAVSPEIEGTFTWKDGSTSLSAVGATQKAVIVFTPAKLMPDPANSTFDPADPKYVASETEIDVTLTKAPLAGSVSWAAGSKAVYGQALTVDTAALLTTPDISGTIGLGDRTVVWRRHNGSADKV